MLKVEGLEKRLGLGLARSRSQSHLVAKIRRLGLVSVSLNCRKVLVSVSSRTKNQMSRSRLGHVRLGLVYIPASYMSDIICLCMCFMGVGGPAGCEEGQSTAFQISCQVLS